MKLLHGLTFLGFGLVTIGTFAIAAGCSSSTPSSTNNNSSVGAEPAKPNAPTTTSTEEHNFALHQLFLGDTPRPPIGSTTIPAQDPNAWQSYGYNIDGKVTTAASTDVCTLAAGAPKSTQIDGNNGIDNSFGENILPIILTTAGSDAASKINAAISGGSFTIMMDITGLQDSIAATQTATGLTGILLAGGQYADGGAPPVDSNGFFLISDDWPVRPDLLSNPSNPKSSTIQFPSAYVVNGTFVNGSPSDITLNLEIGGVALNITVHYAIITFQHQQGHAYNGTIAGVINTTELITALSGVAGRISPSLCPPSQAFNSISAQISQASDIIHDGTNMAGVPCDGISVGLGFTADEIKIPDTVAPLAAPTPDPCASGDAGVADAGGD